MGYPHVRACVRVCARVCVCVVQPLSFVIFLMGAAELVSATSASADTSPEEGERQYVHVVSTCSKDVHVRVCVCVCVCVPSLSGELEAELLGCDCRGVLLSSTDGDRDGLSHTLSWLDT